MISINRGKARRPVSALEASTASKKVSGIRQKCALGGVFVIQLHKPDSADLRPPTDAGRGHQPSLSLGFLQTLLISYFSSSRGFLDKMM